MLSKTIIVALKANEEQIGYCLDQQILTIQSVDQKTNQVKTDFVSKAVVCWEDEDKRSPALSYHDPEDLIWLGFKEDMDEEEEEEAEEGQDAKTPEEETSEILSAPEENTEEIGQEALS